MVWYWSWSIQSVRYPHHWEGWSPTSHVLDGSRSRLHLYRPRWSLQHRRVRQQSCSGYLSTMPVPLQYLVLDRMVGDDLVRAQPHDISCDLISTSCDRFQRNFDFFLLIFRLYPAEVTPLRIRAPANALSTATNWLFNFFGSGAAPYSKEMKLIYIGRHGYRTYVR